MRSGKTIHIRIISNNNNKDKKAKKKTMTFFEKKKIDEINLDSFNYCLNHLEIKFANLAN